MYLCIEQSKLYCIVLTTQKLRRSKLYAYWLTAGKQDMGFATNLSFSREAYGQLPAAHYVTRAFGAIFTLSIVYIKLDKKKSCARNALVVHQNNLRTF